MWSVVFVLTIIVVLCAKIDNEMFCRFDGVNETGGGGCNHHHHHVV